MLRDPEAVRAALEQQGACAVLLQLKSTFGNFYYSSSIDGAELADVDMAAVDSLIDWLSQHGYYLIAEVPAFCDTAFALANSAAALPLSSGALWMDSNGCYWLDPASETVMIYLKQIAREPFEPRLPGGRVLGVPFPGEQQHLLSFRKVWRGADAGRGAGADDVLLREQSHDLV